MHLLQNEVKEALQVAQVLYCRSVTAKDNHLNGLYCSKRINPFAYTIHWYPLRLVTIKIILIVNFLKIND